MRLKCRSARGTIETRTSATSRAVTILSRGSRQHPSDGIDRRKNALERLQELGCSNTHEHGPSGPREDDGPEAEPIGFLIGPEKRGDPAHRGGGRPRRAHEADDAPRERLGRPAREARARHRKLQRREQPPGDGFPAPRRPPDAVSRA